MTNNEINKLQDLIHDRDYLKKLMESIKSRHYITLKSSEARDGFEFLFFDNDFEKFLKEKYEQSNKLIEKITLEGFDNGNQRNN